MPGTVVALADSAWSLYERDADVVDDLTDPSDAASIVDASCLAAYGAARADHCVYGQTVARFVDAPVFFVTS